jgi:hypothetical protein
MLKLTVEAVTYRRKGKGPHLAYVEMESPGKDRKGNAVMRPVEFHGSYMPIEKVRLILTNAKAITAKCDEAEAKAKAVNGETKTTPAAPAGQQLSPDQWEQFKAYQAFLASQQSAPVAGKPFALLAWPSGRPFVLVPAHTHRA